MRLISIWQALCASACFGIASAADSKKDSDNIRTIPLKTHSLSAPYLDSHMQSRWFDYGGDTVIRVDQYIRLTADRKSQSGFIFSRVPLTATNWEIEFEFKIHGKGNVFGDGMALWVTKQRAQQGPVFGFIDQFEGLGIFFDTYKNNRPGVVFPYVMAMMGDGKQNYDKAKDGKENELAGCSARGLHNPSFPSKARLTYFQDQYLKLELMIRTDGQWTTCFDVPNVKLPPVTYLGFTAETGELSDNHDLIRVETKNLYDYDAKRGSGKSGSLNDDFSAYQFDKYASRRKGGGWGWFFLKIVFFLVAIAGVYVGFTVYRSSSRGSRF